MDYETEAHTLYLNANAQLTGKLSLSGGFYYTTATAEIDELYFATNENTIVAPGGRTDDYDVRYINGSEAYSKIDYDSWEVELRAGYDVTESLGLNLVYWYADVDDDAEYVYGDLSGSTYSVTGYVSYRF